MIETALKTPQTFAKLWIKTASCCISPLSQPRWKEGKVRTRVLGIDAAPSVNRRLCVSALGGAWVIALQSGLTSPITGSMEGTSLVPSINVAFSSLHLKIKNKGKCILAAIGEGTFSPQFPTRKWVCFKGSESEDTTGRVSSAAGWPSPIAEVHAQLPALGPCASSLSLWVFTGG